MHCKTCGKSLLNLEFRQISYLLKNVFLSVLHLDKRKQIEKIALLGYLRKVEKQ